MSFVFYLKEKDLQPTPKFLSTLFSASGLENQLFSIGKETSHASMEFLLKIVPPADLSDLDFIPSTQWFKTRNNRQVLIIDCDRVNEGVSAGRFQIRRIWTEDKGKPHVDRVLIKTATRDLYDIAPGVALDAVTDADIKMIIIEFKMSGQSKTDLFQFFLNVVDTHSPLTIQEDKDCDPQVGNDPP
jgi:hypothetical protein